MTLGCMVSMKVMISTSYYKVPDQDLPHVACYVGVYTGQGFFQDYGQGGSKWDVKYYWGGAKLYYIPESKAYDKLGEPGIMLHCANHNQHA